MNSIAQRRQDERERRRSEIVDAADALAREHRWNDVTVDGVAKRARLSRALVYLYFRDKTDLHAALWERARDELVRRFGAAVAEAGVGSGIEAIGRAYVRFAEEMPHYFEALGRFEARTPEPAEEPAATAQCPDDLHGLIVEALRAAQQAGTVRADCGDLDLTAVALWAFTHGLIQISSTKRSQLEALGLQHEAILEQAFILLGRTIGPPG